MSIRTEAEEHLRVIRSLMEKATVYRAISAPGALVGGLGALAVSMVGAASSGGTDPFLAGRFLGLWIGLLFVVTIANLLLLSRDATRRGRSVLFTRYEARLRAMLPGLVAGAVVILPFGFSLPDLLAGFWILFYGMSLLAASHFAPKSICWLGRAFFAAGAGLLLAGTLAGPSLEFGNSFQRANLLMGGTFGIFHLVYATLTWPRTEAKTAS